MTILTTWLLGVDGEPVEPDFDRLVAQLINIENTRRCIEQQQVFLLEGTEN